MKQWMYKKCNADTAAIAKDIIFQEYLPESS